MLDLWRLDRDRSRHHRVTATVWSAAADLWTQDDRYATPGLLAAALTDGKEAQRAHLDLIDTVLLGCLRGDHDRVMIFMPPQVGKSRRVAEWGPAWLLHHRPDWRIGVASYAAGLARKRGRFVRNLLRDYPELGLTLSPDSAAADRWDLEGHRGGMLTAGVGGGMTGEAIDAAIVDDPVKGREQADSAVVRENTYDWYREVLETRLGPEGFVCLMQTRWHPEDLGGRLLREEGRDIDGGRWHVLTVPAIAEDHSPPLDPVTGQPDGPCPCGRSEVEPHDPLGRTPGTPLDHPRMSAEQYGERAAKVRITSPRTYAALLQQRPTPDDATLLVSREVLRSIREPLDPAGHDTARRSVVALDPSGGGDDEAGLVAGYLGADKRAHLTHDRSARMSAHQWGRAACLLAHEIVADAFVVEKNYGGDQAGTVVRQAWDALAIEGTVTGLCPAVVEVSAKKGKVARAEPVAQAMREDRVRLSGVFPQMEDQWATYQQGQDSPDRLDASVYLVSHLLPEGPTEATIHVPTGAVPLGAGASASARYR